MNIVLINPFPGGKGLNEATVLPPLGLGYMGAVLEENGFSVSIIDANLERFETDSVMKKIPKGSELVGMYMNSFNYNSCLDLSSEIKNTSGNTYIVFGGPMPSASPEMIMRDFPCDGLICGEGEYSLLKVVQNIINNKPPFSRDIPGAVYRNNKNELIINPAERISDIDQLPYPAYHLLPPFGAYKIRGRQKPSAPLITSRGCVFQCIFCSKDIFERRVTFRSAQNVLKEIDFLVDRYRIRQVDILDDNFMQKRSRVEEILDGLIERNYGLSINLQSGIRAEHLDEKILKKMKRAGFYKIAFGIESADHKVLKIINKQLDLEKVKQAAVLAKKIGFDVYGFFIIGLPGETDEGFKRTIDFAREVDFDVANFCMAVPFAGTELYRMVEENGSFLINTDKNIGVGFYAGKVFYEIDDLKEQDVLRRYKRAYKEFYTLSKRIRIILNIRSLSELIWLWNAGIFVLKGVFSRQMGKR